jgi:hypothetical protein
MGAMTPSFSRRTLLLSSLYGLLAPTVTPCLASEREAEQDTPLKDNSDILPPERVRVLPLFFVPSDQPLPTTEQKEKIMRHLKWSQKRFAELLQGITFEIVEKMPNGEVVPLVYRGKRELEYYRTQPENGSPAFTAEILHHIGHTRFNCPYILLTVTVNNKGQGGFGGGGRSLNGGYNTGGGIVNVYTLGLDTFKNFQSTLQHELGHSFGLTHVDSYNRSMENSPSIMSYNQTKHTNGWEPAAVPAILTPEDIRALALNQRALPGATFVPSRDVPSGYPLAPSVKWIGPMVLPDGHPLWTITVESEAGQEYGTAPGNIVQNCICPNVPPTEPPPATRFEPQSMWQSRNIGPGKWARLKLTFPVEVTLDSIAVYSEHSGRHHRAAAVRGHAVYGEDLPGPTLIPSVSLPRAEALIRFEKTRAKLWRFAFQTNETGAVVLRGLRFFYRGKEVFPPAVPELTVPEAI